MYVELKYIVDHWEYPKADHLLTGYKLGIFYSYTGSYIVSHINLHMEETHGWMLERYERYDAAEVAEVFKSKHWVDVNEVDDVIKLGYLSEDKSVRVLIWLDRDVSDCCFLIFQTNDTQEEVAANVRAWLEAKCHKDWAGVERENTETISGVYDMPLEWVQRVQP